MTFFLNYYFNNFFTSFNIDTHVSEKHFLVFIIYTKLISDKKNKKYFIV